jgi:hypothetical protein
MSEDKLEKRIKTSIGKISTSIELPVELWRKTKIYAAKEGLKLTQVVEAALRKYLELSENEEAKSG